MSRPIQWLLVVVAGTWLGCADPVSEPQADGVVAERHRREAEAHSKDAEAHSRRYDPRAGSPSYGGAGPSSGTWTPDGDWESDRDWNDDLYWDMQQYNPSIRHGLEAEEHERRAREHLEMARKLESFERRECRAFPSQTRALCPLLGPIESVEEIEGGVRLHLAADVDVNAVVAHMRCHVAFARTRDHAGMDQCPLYLENVRIQRLARTRSIDLIASGDAAIRELRRRAHAHVRRGSPR